MELLSLPDRPSILNTVCFFLHWETKSLMLYKSQTDGGALEVKLSKSPYFLGSFLKIKRQEASQTTTGFCKWEPDPYKTVH